MSSPLVKHHVLDIAIAHVRDDEFVDWAEAASLDPTPQTCFGVNAHSVTLAQRDRAYANALRRCSAVLCDGFSVQAASQVLPGPVPPRLIITDFHDEIHRRIAKRNGAVFIIGYEDGIAEQAATAVHERHPGLRVVGHHHGYFDAGSDTETNVIEQIRATRPDVLWVGMGNPKQELFIDRNLERLSVPLVFSCGAMWKYDLGLLRRAPRWVSTIGMEWFYRCLTQGPAMWARYGIGNAQFLSLVFRSWCEQRQKEKSVAPPAPAGSAQ